MGACPAPVAAAGAAARPLGPLSCAAGHHCWGGRDSDAASCLEGSLRPIASAGTVADARNRRPPCWRTGWNCRSCSAQGTLAGADYTPGVAAGRGGLARAGVGSAAAGRSRRTAHGVPAPEAAPGRCGLGPGRRGRRVPHPAGRPGAPVHTRSAARPPPRTYGEATACRSNPNTPPPPSSGPGSARTTPFPGEGCGTSSEPGPRTHTAGRRWRSGTRWPPGVSPGRVTPTPSTASASPSHRQEW